MSIVAREVWKSFGEPPTDVLQGINLKIEDGEFTALTGRSGSGKSTLLYLLSSLDFATRGIVEIAGTNIADLNESDLCQFRNETMGFVFQFHYLISELSALENVMLPSKRTKKRPSTQDYAKELLASFGLAEKMHRLPRQLSGGEQQRVAIARALVMKPKYLFADEPTGSLDSVNGESVMNLIRDANKNLNTTVVMVTHDPDFANSARRQIFLADGKIAL